MKTLFFISICFFGLFFSQNAFSQTVTISTASVISVPSNSIIYVSGTLTGVKGIPITGYTIDLLYGTGQSVNIATNIPSSGGNYSYTGLVPTATPISGPYQIKVTTNRQSSQTANANTCSCN